jgi:hypothetical protein
MNSKHGSSTTRPVRRSSPSPARSGSSARLARLLHDQGMPSREIRIVLETEDPVVVQRYLELHRERLEERLAWQIRTLEAINREVARDRR